MRKDGVRPSLYLVGAASMAQFLAFLFMPEPSDGTVTLETVTAPESGLDMSRIFQPVSQDAAIEDLLDAGATFAVEERTDP